MAEKSVSGYQSTKALSMAESRVLPNFATTRTLAVKLLVNIFPFLLDCNYA